MTMTASGWTRATRSETCPICDGPDNCEWLAKDDGVTLVYCGRIEQGSTGTNGGGQFLHVLGDLLGSVAVVVAGVLVLSFGWHIADPIFGIVIGVLILASSFRLLWKVLHVLMEGTPAHLDLHQLCQRLEELDGVTGVHDIHAWSITTGYDALSAHVTADASVMGDPNPVMQRLRDIASTEFGIGHVTIQLEDSMDGCDEDHHIEHPNVRPDVYTATHRHDG